MNFHGSVDVVVCGDAMVVAEMEIFLVPPEEHHQEFHPPHESRSVFILVRDFVILAHVKRHVVHEKIVDEGNNGKVVKQIIFIPRYKENLASEHPKDAHGQEAHHGSFHCYSVRSVANCVDADVAEADGLKNIANEVEPEPVIFFKLGPAHKNSPECSEPARIKHTLELLHPNVDLMLFIEQHGLVSGIDHGEHLQTVKKVSLEGEAAHHFKIKYEKRSLPFFSLPIVFPDYFRTLVAVSNFFMYEFDLFAIYAIVNGLHYFDNT